MEKENDQYTKQTMAHTEKNEEIIYEGVRKVCFCCCQNLNIAINQLSQC